MAPFAAANAIGADEHISPSRKMRCAPFSPIAFASSPTWGSMAYSFNKS